jgi:hypothetical protein
VDVAALVRHVADLVGAAFAAAGTAAGLVLDGCGGGATGLEGMVLEEQGERNGGKGWGRCTG